jgi:alpha-aminoadipic semialdehyde synthase
MMAVDILPASIPLDASTHFSDALLPYVKTLVREYRGECAGNEYQRALERATICKGGDLVGKHRWLAESVRAWRETVDQEGTTVPKSGSGPASINTVRLKKKVLMLGSGMVAGPAVDEISKRPDVELVVGPFLFCPSSLVLIYTGVCS